MSTAWNRPGRCWRGATTSRTITNRIRAHPLTLCNLFLDKLRDPARLGLEGLLL